MSLSWSCDYMSCDHNYFICFIAPDLLGHKTQAGDKQWTPHGLHNQLPSGIANTP